MHGMRLESYPQCKYLCHKVVKVCQNTVPSKNLEVTHVTTLSVINTEIVWGSDTGQTTKQIHVALFLLPVLVNCIVTVSFFLSVWTIFP